MFGGDRSKQGRSLVVVCVTLFSSLVDGAHLSARPLQWSAPTKREVSPVLHLETGVNSAVTAIAYSPGDRWIAVGDSSGTVSLVEAVSGALIRKFVHGRKITALAFLRRDGSILTGTGDGSLQQWDLGTGGLIRTWAPASASWNALVDGIQTSADGEGGLT